METNKDYLNRILNLARVRGYCRTQNKFAELVGINKSTLSKALAGDEKYLTDSLIRRVQMWVRQNGLEGDPIPEPAKPQRPDIVIPAATADLYNNMSETIRIQAEIIARLQGGAAHPISVYGSAEKRDLDIGK